MIHNHGPNRERGLNCPQHEIDGRLVGHCLLELIENSDHWLQVLKDAETMKQRALRELGLSDDPR